MASIKSDDTSVRVAVRVRPLIGIETVKDCQEVVQYPNNNQVFLANSNSSVSTTDRTFTYDHVFPGKIHQEQVYGEAVCPLVEGFLGGYNATILAYGQTGSGKTFTMGTDAKTLAAGETAFGIIPRVMQCVFEKVEESQDTEYEVKVQFLEIHNENIHDLLAHNSTASKNGLNVREANGEIIVVGATEEIVCSKESMLNCLERGTACRSTGSTNMNAQSSRSHAIFTIILTQRKLEVESEAVEEEATQTPEESKVKNRRASGESNASDDFDDEVTISKFHFVDLAGSERIKKTGAVGQRMKEGININSGLLALANCISALSDEKRRGGHVPFRDSKITRLLQDSLGGNSKTLMIACVSPADVNAEETLSTLRYANRARNIKNKPVINKDPHQMKIARMRSRIRELEALLAIQGKQVPRSGLNSAKETTIVSNDEYSLLQDQSAIYEKEVIRLSDKLKEARSQINGLSEKFAEARKEKDIISYALKKLMAKHGETESQLSEEEQAMLSKNDVKRDQLEQLQEALKTTKAALVKTQSELKSFTQPVNRATLAKKMQFDHTSDISDVDINLAKEDPAFAEDIEQMSALSDVKQRSHQHQMDQLSRVSKNLSSDIKEKMELMKQLDKQREQNQHMHRQYITKMGQMEKELNDVQQQRDGYLQQQKAGLSNEARVKYEKKLTDLNKKISTLRDKLKENKYLQQKLDQDQRKIAQLQGQIDEAKKHKVRLQQQMAAKADQYREWQKEKENNIKQLVKQARQNKIMMSKMKMEATKQALVLKRKSENEALLRKKLNRAKDLASKASDMRHKRPLGNSQKAFGMSFPKKPKLAPRAASDTTAGDQTPTVRKPLTPTNRKPLSERMPNGVNAKSKLYISSPLKTPLKTPLKQLSSFGELKNRKNSIFGDKGTKSLVFVEKSLGNQNVESVSKVQSSEVFVDKENVPVSNEMNVNLRGNENGDLNGNGVVMSKNMKVDISDGMSRLQGELLKKLNTGSLKELMELQMIGKKKAEMIVEERNKKPFATLEDLVAVKIAASTFLKRNMFNEIWDQQDINVLSTAR